jgi:hypothetical protein
MTWKWMQIVLMPDDDWKAETCDKFIVYAMSIQIIELTEANNKNNLKIFWH